MHQSKRLLEICARGGENPGSADVLQQSVDALCDDGKPDVRGPRSTRYPPLRADPEGVVERRDIDTLVRRTLQ